MQGLATKLLLATFMFALTLIFAVPAHAAPLGTGDAKTMKAKAKGRSPKAPGAEKPIAGGPKDEAALWWNDPGIEKSLKLSDEQRKKMADLLAAFRTNVPRQAQLEAFHETLVQRDWKQAGSENEKNAERADASVRARGKLKIDILSVLTEEQHATLVDRFPRLIYKPWARAMRSGASR